MTENKLLEQIALESLKTKARFCARNIRQWADNEEHENKNKLSLLLGVIKMYHDSQSHALFLEEIEVEKKQKPLELDQFTRKSKQ